MCQSIGECTALSSGSHGTGAVGGWYPTDPLDSREPATRRPVRCRYLVDGARALGLEVIDRCNLTVLLEPEQEDLVDFLASRQVRRPLPEGGTGTGKMNSKPACFCTCTLSTAARQCCSLPDNGMHTKCQQKAHERQRHL